MFSTIKDTLPSIKNIIGCTAGGIIGPTSILGDPQEIEGRASLTMMLIDSKSSGDVFRMSNDDIDKYINDDSSSSITKGKGVTLLLGIDSTKSRLSTFVDKLGNREGTTTITITTTTNNNNNNNNNNNKDLKHLGH
jgi:small ligand-binding sensory domain FIST